jgi:hypothetical protein
MKSSLLITGLCAVVSAGCSGVVSPAGPAGVSATATAGGADIAEGQTRGSAVKTVPFKGDLQGQYGSPGGQFPLIHETIDAAGQATHLGRYALEISETVNLLQASATGAFTFTAANGDTVSGEFTGRAQPGPLVAIVEEATITGGTGRFASATGSFTIHRTFDPVTRTTTGSFAGLISHP